MTKVGVYALIRRVVTLVFGPAPAWPPTSAAAWLLPVGAGDDRDRHRRRARGAAPARRWSATWSIASVGTICRRRGGMFAAPASPPRSTTCVHSTLVIGAALPAGRPDRRGRGDGGDSSSAAPRATRPRCSARCSSSLAVAVVRRAAAVGLPRQGHAAAGGAGARRRGRWSGRWCWATHCWRWSPWRAPAAWCSGIRTATDRRRPGSRRSRWRPTPCRRWCCSAASSR